MVVEENGVRGPWRELRDQHNRQHQPADKRARNRNPAYAGPGTRSGQLAVDAGGAERAQKSWRYPSRCRLVKASHTMKLTL